MNFLTWYGIGIATVVITLFIEAFKHSPKGHRIRQTFYELYDILYKKADLASTSILALAALLGPILPVIFIYFIARNWHDNLVVDEDDKKIYPWDNN